MRQKISSAPQKQPSPKTATSKPSGMSSVTTGASRTRCFSAIENHCSERPLRALSGVGISSLWRLNSTGTPQSISGRRRSLTLRLRYRSQSVTYRSLFDTVIGGVSKGNNVRRSRILPRGMAGSMADAGADTLAGMTEQSQKAGFQTRAIHAGYDPDEMTG